MPKTVLLFDIDGTLLLSGGCGKIALNRIFKELYGENDIWDNLKPDGKTDVAIIRECYQRRFKREPDAIEIHQLKQAYLRENAIELKRATRFRLMPHVPETLAKLATYDHIVMGLATGNFKASGLDKLARGGIDHYFRFGGFACDSEDRLTLTRKALERAREYLGGPPKDLYIIGDTVHDIRCGKAIGAKTVAVCTGSTTRETLEAERPDQILATLAELTL